MIRHFVALGDSFTQGAGDPSPQIPLRSAHDWLALWMGAANPGLKYTNLAEYGLRSWEIRDQQMNRVLSLNPDFVSLIGPGNDALRGPFSAERLRAELNLIFGAFRSIGARLFTATTPDFTLRLDLPEGVARRMRRNLEATNAIMRDLASQHEAILYEFWHGDLEHNPAIWSEDGVHPNAYGYLEIAGDVAPLLQKHGIELKPPSPLVGDDAERSALLGQREGASAKHS